MHCALLDGWHRWRLKRLFWSSTCCPTTLEGKSVCSRSRQALEGGVKRLLSLDTAIMAQVFGPSLVEAVGRSPRVRGQKGVGEMVSETGTSSLTASVIIIKFLFQFER